MNISKVPHVEMYLTPWISLQYIVTNAAVTKIFSVPKKKKKSFRLFIIKSKDILVMINVQNMEVWFPIHSSYCIE